MWFAHVTVANVIVKNDKFLMVKEISDGKLVINQPAGHVEDGETIVDALLRETLEETGWHVRPEAALGISQFRAPNGETYFRHSFVSEALHTDAQITLDQDIVEVCWMSLDDIHANKDALRSPLVLNDIKRHQNGARFKLDDMYYVAN